MTVMRQYQSPQRDLLAASDFRIRIFTNGAAAGAAAGAVRSEAVKHGFRVSDFKPDLIVAVGGDGTLIKAAKFRLPIMAVRAGTRNHLLDIDPENIGRAMAMLKHGRYKKVEYSMVAARLGRRKIFAFNEVGMISTQPQSILVRLKHGHDPLLFEGDGVLVSTPQGSTGWAFSANGTYLDSRVGALLVTPLNPVMNPLRSIVLPSETIEMELRDKGYEEHANLVVDGKIIARINRGKKVTITPTGRKTIVYRFFSTNPIKDMLCGHERACSGTDRPQLIDP
jgi:NAD+ kinase